MEPGGTRARRESLRVEFNVLPSRPNITIFFTILAVGVSFAWLGVEDASKWEAGVALYILGCKWSSLDCVLYGAF